ncbi:MAG: hypothetical protein NZ737_03290, partial [Candidatus Poseidoniaceae archaeon]|nr:hypothetical protein [Candidatus Poseidoniaceae archaeon]
MADTEAEGIKLETWLLIGFIVALLLSTSVIVFTSMGKDTVFSAYVTDSENENLQFQQISTMRTDLGSGDGGMGYDVANTMS